jgi:hypothetical protein
MTMGAASLFQNLTKANKSNWMARRHRSIALWKIIFRADSTDSSHVIAKSPIVPQPSRVTGKLEEIPRIRVADDSFRMQN